LYLKKWHWLLDIDECRTSQLNSGFTAIVMSILIPENKVTKQENTDASLSPSVEKIK